MTSFLKIDIWKKGANKQISMPDYEIEISEGDLHTISDMISALVEIADVKEMKKDDKKTNKR